MKNIVKRAGQMAVQDRKQYSGKDIHWLISTPLRKTYVFANSLWVQY